MITVDNTPLVEVATYEAAAFYEWDETHVFWNPATGQYLWFHDSGCSCNYYEVPKSLGEFTEGSREGAIKALKSHSIDTYTLDGDALNREIAKVRDFNPPMTIQSLMAAFKP